MASNHPLKKDLVKQKYAIADMTPQEVCDALTNISRPFSIRTRGDGTRELHLVFYDSSGTELGTRRVTCGNLALVTNKKFTNTTTLNEVATLHSLDVA